MMFDGDCRTCELLCDIIDFIKDPRYEADEKLELIGKHIDYKLWQEPKIEREKGE